MTTIEKRVHELYWDKDVNGARTTLLILGELLPIPLKEQTLHAAIGLHGAGGFRAQCGLVEGGLMAIGMYYSSLHKEEEAIVSVCYRYAREFSDTFGSLRCFELRPGGFRPEDPPHKCEKLTCEAIAFTYDFIVAHQE